MDLYSVVLAVVVGSSPTGSVQQPEFVGRTLEEAIGLLSEGREVEDAAPVVEADARRRGPSSLALSSYGQTMYKVMYMGKDGRWHCAAVEDSYQEACAEAKAIARKYHCKTCVEKCQK